MFFHVIWIRTHQIINPIMFHFHINFLEFSLDLIVPSDVVFIARELGVIARTGIINMFFFSVRIKSFHIFDIDFLVISFWIIFLIVREVNLINLEFWGLWKIIYLYYSYIPFWTSWQLVRVFLTNHRLLFLKFMMWSCGLTFLIVSFDFSGLPFNFVHQILEDLADVVFDFCQKSVECHWG